MPRRTNNVTRVAEPRLCPALLSPMRLCLQLNKSIAKRDRAGNSTPPEERYGNIRLCRAIAALRPSSYAKYVFIGKHVRGARALYPNRYYIKLPFISSLTLFFFIILLLRYLFYYFVTFFSSRAFSKRSIIERTPSSRKNARALNQEYPCVKYARANTLFISVFSTTLEIISRERHNPSCDE